MKLQKSRQFNTFLISLENFDRKSNNWGSLGVRSCKKGRHSVKKKDAEKGIYCQADGIYRPWECVPLPPSSWPNEFHTYLIPLSQFLSKEGIVFTCLVTCKCNPYYNLKSLAHRNPQFSNPQHDILATCNLATSNFSNPQHVAYSLQSVARSPQSECGPQPAARNLSVARDPQPAIRSPQSVTRNPQPAMQSVARNPQPAMQSVARNPQPAARNLATLLQNGKLVWVLILEKLVWVL